VPGPLLGEVVKNMKDKRDGKMSSKRKAFIYSAVCDQNVFKSSYYDSVLSVNKTGPSLRFLRTANAFVYLCSCACIQHDSTVAAFLGAMGIFDGLQPQYTASVLVELSNSSGQLSVAVWYRYSVSVDKAIQLTIPGE